jgi:hypothetical protein
MRMTSGAQAQGAATLASIPALNAEQPRAVDRRPEM